MVKIERKQGYSGEWHYGLEYPCFIYFCEPLLVNLCAGDLIVYIIAYLIPLAFAMCSARI